MRSGRFDALARSGVARRLDLHRQYGLHATGDVARRLHLARDLHDRGGWYHRPYHGRISDTYLSNHFGYSYPGPRWYPHHSWYPRWSSWVSWSWWDFCHPAYDPRPIWGRPYYYDPSPPLVVWQFPVWTPLPVAASGTWVDAPEPVVAEAQLDLQLLAVRFVDPGHPERDLGPRYRVWFRNTSKEDITTPFNVMLVASNDEQIDAKMPQAGVRVESIKAGQTQSVDIRLPKEANSLGRDAQGRPAPFAQLHAIVDSHEEIAEVFEKNNGATIARGDVLPVDPAAFSTDADTAVAGGVISIAGEGFGPEPGQVLVYVKGLELEAEIQGWYDLGVRVKLPELPVASVTDAEIVVVRGDGAAANALPLKLAPAGAPLVPAPD